MNDIIGLGTALVGVIVWFVRLESRQKSTDNVIDLFIKDLDHLKMKHDALDSKVLDELSRVRESLARIEGSIGIDAKKKERR